MEGKDIFRKKTLKRISSPEELDDYLAVTGPGIWFTLIAIVVILIGAITWAALGHLDTTVKVAVISNGNDAVCYVPVESAEAIIKKGSVRISDKDCTLTDTGMANQIVTGETSSAVLMAGNLHDGSIVKPLKVDAKLTQGVYEGEVTVESVTPISFIIN